MTVRHAALLTDSGVILRRRYDDGAFPIAAYWGGRECGWTDFLRAKTYPHKASAQRALGRILAHERELGIARRTSRRY